MTLIDLYVEEVGRRLPLRGRKDIEAELRSTLEDMLEDRSKKAGRPADEAMVLDLLREYGPPDKIAGTYYPNQYLIGPRMYPFFVRVLKIVLAVLVIVLPITLGVQISQQALSGPELAKAIATGLLGVLGACLQAFGNIALVFAILERVVPASEFRLDEEKKEWDPATLKKTAAPTTLKPWEPITEILVGAAALALFNGYSQLIGFHFVQDGQWISIPVLTQAFFRWLPYLNVLWILQIGLNLFLLRAGRWQTGTRWISIALDVAGIAIAYFLLAGPPIASLPAETLLANGMTAAAAQKVDLALQQAVRLGIAVAMIAQSVKVMKYVVRLVLRRPRTA